MKTKWELCEDPLEMINHLCKKNGLFHWINNFFTDKLQNKLLDRKLRLISIALWETYGKASDFNFSCYKDLKKDLNWIDRLQEPLINGNWNLYLLSPQEFVKSAIKYYTKKGITPVQYATIAGMKENRKRVNNNNACHIIRDIIGNKEIPSVQHKWNPVPNWINNDIISFAKIAYNFRTKNKCNYNVENHENCISCLNTGFIESETLDQLTISALADIIEENSCDSKELINHLRYEGPHYRGCWGIDFILNGDWQCDCSA